MDSIEYIAPQNPNRMRNFFLSALSLTVITVLLFTAEHWGNQYISRVFRLGAIYAISVLSLNLINGCTGQLSLGNPGFMAIGAYVCCVLFMDPEVKEVVWFVVPMNPLLLSIKIPFVPAMLCGGLVAAIFAFFIGFPVLRLRGDYLSIATLGFSEIIRVIITNLPTITNGSIGISKIPNHATPLMVYGTLAIITTFMVLLLRTSYGNAFRAIREDQAAAEAMGISLFRHKMMSFIISAFVAGISGALVVTITGAVEPLQFRYTYVYQFLLMMVLGGQGSISGSIIGAMLVTVALEWFRFMDEPFVWGPLNYPGFPGMRMVLFAIILMIVVLLWSRGIFGDKEFSWDRLFERAQRFKVWLQSRFAGKEGDGR